MMTAPDERAAIEQACEALYTAADPTRRQAAEDATKGLRDDVARLTALLSPPSQQSSSSSIYAPFFAASSLARVVGERWESLHRAQWEGIRDAALAFLWHRTEPAFLAAQQQAPPAFLVAGVCQLFARTAKRAWLEPPASPDTPPGASMDTGSRSVTPAGSGYLSDHESFQQNPSRIERNVRFRARELLSAAERFLQESELPTPERVLAGIALLQETLREFSANRALCRMPMLEHRQRALLFRDTALRSVLDIALEKVRATRGAVREQALQLVLLCFSFDFSGTGRTIVPESVLHVFRYGRAVPVGIATLEPEPDDLQSNTAAIRFPITWRHLFQDASLLRLLFDLYAQLAPPSSCWALECVVQLMAARHEVFASEATLEAFVSTIMQAIQTIFLGNIGLSYAENHHALCRIIGQFISSNLAVFLPRSPIWQQFFPLFVQFSVASIKAWQWSPNSVHYILGFWSRFVLKNMPRRGSINGGSGSIEDEAKTAPQLIPEAGFAVLQAYLSSCLEMATLASQGELQDNPLSSFDAVSDFLVFLPHLTRAKYTSTMELLVSVFDPLLTTLEQQQRSPSAVPTVDCRVAVAQAAWILYFAGAALLGRELQIGGFSNEEDVIDAELTARIIRASRFCISETPSSSSSSSSSAARDEFVLHLATIHAFTRLQRVIFGALAPESSDLFCEKLGLLIGTPNPCDEKSLIMFAFAQVRGSLLKYGDSIPDVASAAATLLAALASSPRSSEIIRRSGDAAGIVAYLLGTPTASAPTALAQASMQAYGMLHGATERWKAAFYSALVALLLAQSPKGSEPYTVITPQDVIDESLDAVVAPLGGLLAALQAMAPAAGMPFSQEYCATASGAIRVMSGIAGAINDSDVFRSFFGWLHPEHSRLLTVGAAALPSEPRIALESLRFVAELVSTETQRIRELDSSLPESTLLVKLVASVAAAYSAPLVAALASCADQAKRTQLHRGICYLLLAVGRLVATKWLPLGALAGFGDSSVRDLVAASLRVVLALPLSDVVDFPKLTLATFSMLADACLNHPHFVCATLDQASFANVVGILEYGISSSFPDVVEMACVALFGLLQAFVVSKKVSRRGIDRVRLIQREYVASSLRFETIATERILVHLSEVIVQAAIFGDESSIPPLARPLLALAAIIPDLLQRLTPVVQGMQPSREDTQGELVEAFSELGEAAGQLKEDPLSDPSWHIFSGVLESFHGVAAKLVLQS